MASDQREGSHLYFMRLPRRFAPRNDFVGSPRRFVPRDDILDRPLLFRIELSGCPFDDFKGFFHLSLMCPEAEDANPYYKLTL